VSPSTSTPEYTIRTKGNTRIFTPLFMPWQLNHRSYQIYNFLIIHYYVILTWPRML
jgi:hypothetical protein